MYTAGSLAIVDTPQIARTCILRVFGLPMSCCRLSLVLRLFCFVFVFILTLKPRPFVQSLFDIQAPRQPHVFLSFFLFSFFPFVSLEMSLFPSTFVPLLFYFCMEGTSHVFSFFLPEGDGAFLYIVTAG